MHQRLRACDWTAVPSHLDAYGWALLPKLFTPAECTALAVLYDDQRIFRSRVVMARHGRETA